MVTAGFGLERVDLVLGDHRVVEDDADDDERHGRVDDLDGRVLVELPGHLVRVAAAVGDHRPEDETPDEHRDGEAGDRHPGPELELRLTLGRGAPEGAEGRQGATAEHRSESTESSNRRESSQPAGHPGPHERDISQDLRAGAKLAIPPNRVALQTQVGWAATPPEADLASFAARPIRRA